MTLHARQERGLLVDGGKPPHRAATRRRVMHPMIVINGSNIVAARLSVGLRVGRQVPLRQRGELSARTLSHAAEPALDLSRVHSVPVAASHHLAVAKLVRSHGTYLMDITARNPRGYPSTNNQEVNYFLLID